LGEGDLLDLITQIYAAAADSALWQPVIAQIVTACAATYGALYFTTTGRQAHAIGAGILSPREGRRETEAGRFETWRQALHNRPVGKVYNGPDLLAATRPGAFHLAAGLLFRADDLLAIFGVERPASQQAFGTAELALLRRLLPHLQRAVEMQRKLAVGTAERQTLATLLDQIRSGVVVVDASAHVVSTNRVADAILARRDGLVVTQSGALLSAQNAKEARALHKLIAAAAAGQAGLGDAHAGAMRVSRPSRKRALEVVVTPLPPADLGFGATRDLASVFFNDPEHSLEASEELLRRFFGFSPNEARLVLALLNGTSVAEAAAGMAVTENTARTLLRRAIRKSGAASQADLIRLIMAGLAGRVRR
jgi:DNA-binding CsgD family transcriptional regulator